MGIGGDDRVVHSSSQPKRLSNVKVARLWCEGGSGGIMSPQLGTIHIFTSRFACHIDLLDRIDYSHHAFLEAG